MTACGPVPRLRLAGFYFLFFSAVGGFLPYWALYLESLGLGASSIGAMMALMMATRIVAPNVWGWIADRRGRRMGVIRSGAWAAVALFSLVPFVRDPFALAGVIVLYSAFWTAVMPQFEAVTLAHLAERSVTYSRIRLWGSVGFVVASAAIGAVLERRGVGVLPWLLLALMASVAVTAFVVREPASARAGPADAIPGPGAGTGGTTPEDERAHGAVSARRRLRDRGAGTRLHPALPAVALLVAAALMQASHGPYYVFFSIHLQSLGFPRDEIGALWALGVVAEVVLFAVMPALLARVRLEPLLVGCFALTAARWAMLATLPATLPVLVAVQCLHAVSFGAHHAVSIALVHRLFAGGREGRGQALYSSLSFGAGGAAGSAAAGWLWAVAGPQATWLAAAGAAALGGVVAWTLTRSSAGAGASP